MTLSRAGYKETTIMSIVSSLRAIAKRTDLLNPDAVKTYLARAQMEDGRKEILAGNLAKFYGFLRTPFEKPRYVRVDKVPFIPLECEIDALIAGIGPKSAAFLQLVKETGARPGEAWAMKWTDIDAESQTITVTPEKRSNARRLKVSQRLLAMLNALSKQWSYVFHNPDADPVVSFEWFRRTFLNQRKALAIKLQNPRLDRISFKTLRHWKATAEYHRTKDILHVMQLLGDKNIKNTLVYTHLVDFGGDDFVCKAAKTVDEAKGLVENGFDYVTDIDGMKLLRKRK